MDKVARLKFLVFDYLPKDEQYGLIYKAKIASHVKKSLTNGYKQLIKKFAKTTERLNKCRHESPQYFFSKRNSYTFVMFDASNHSVLRNPLLSFGETAAEVHWMNRIGFFEPHRVIVRDKASELFRTVSANGFLWKFKIVLVTQTLH